MAIKSDQKYKTPAGLILKIKTVRESGIHSLVLIDNQVNIIPEKRNKKGHVITRNVRICSEETIKSFEKIK